MSDLPTSHLSQFRDSPGHEAVRGWLIERLGALYADMLQGPPDHILERAQDARATIRLLTALEGATQDVPAYANEAIAAMQEAERREREFVDMQMEERQRRSSQPL